MVALGVLGLEFAELRLPLDAMDGLSSEERTRWVALASFDERGQRVAKDDPELAVIKLRREAFDDGGDGSSDDEAKQLEGGDDEAPVLAGAEVPDGEVGDSDVEGDEEEVPDEFGDEVEAGWDHDDGE